MAIRWQIPFAPLRSRTVYTINIYDDDYSGTPAVLTGAAQPMETQEVDSEDFFLPVRTQSGYIRIVDNGKTNAGVAFDWKELVPETATSRQVTLTNSSGTELWRGYLQPQTFSGRLYEATQEREFPICCPLRVLEGVEVDASVREIKNFAYLLRQILDNTGWQWDNIYFSGTADMLYDWLRRKIDWMNFLEEDQNHSIVAKYNYYELLEEMCRFFGWTCRTFGANIYFLSPDEKFYSAMVRIGEQDLDLLVEDGTPQVQEIADYYTLDLDDDIYASVKQDVELVRGVKKVTLTADINKQEVIMKIPYSKIEERYKTNAPTDYQYGTTGHHFILNSPDYTYGSRYKLPDMIIETSGLSDSLNHGASFLVQEYYEGALTYKHNYNWSTSLKVKGQFFWYSPLFRMYSIAPHNYDHGVFVISAGSSQVFTTTTRNEYTGNGKLFCTLSIGNKWWNGTSWQDTNVGFEIPIGREGQPEGTGSGSIITNRALNGPYNAYEGYGIPIDSAMGGIVDFQISGVDLDNTHSQDESVELTNLEMKFVRMKTYAPYSDRDENIYTWENQVPFTDEISLDTIFATNNGNALGLGIIMNRGGAYASSLYYAYPDGDGVERPEAHLVERIGTYNNNVKKVAILEVRTDELPITPATIVSLPWGTGDGYPISISHQWRDDVTMLKIMEI